MMLLDFLTKDRKLLATRCQLLNVNMPLLKVSRHTAMVSTLPRTLVVSFPCLYKGDQN